MLVSRLAAMVGKETEKIRLDAPAKKFPSAALASSNQLICEVDIDVSLVPYSALDKMRAAITVARSP